MPAQQLTVFLLKSAHAMVLWLGLNVLHDGIQLTRAYGKRAIPALPEKATIRRIKCFDPFGRRFLYLLNQLGLSNGSRNVVMT